jgi:phospholipid transport system transporter-binding protein
MSEFRLAVESNSGLCRASGTLSFATAADAHAQLQRCLSAGGHVRIDCGGLERIDSAGLAVLLDLVALAREQGVELRYVSLPTGVLRLARLSGVEVLLPV